MESTVIGKKYKILDKIGNGKFGIVYKGMNVKTKQIIAIKTENRNSSIKLLKNETTILKYLYDHGSRVIPIVYWYGTDFTNSYLIMTHYDISLYHFCISTLSLSIDKINKIMLVCIDILETIHKQYIIHRDIKPQNFMISNDEVYLIDFGLATFYIDKNGEHQSDLYCTNILGTPKYISYNLHNGNSPSRRDDLISLGYIYLLISCRELPWDNIPVTEFNDFTENHILHYKNQTRKKIKEWKNLCIICEKINDKIQNYLNYCYRLNYESEPNYEELKKLFSLTPFLI